MNENYNNCRCERVAPKEPTIQNLVAETLERLDKLNEQLSSICETLYGTAYGNPQKLEVKCLNDALVLLLDKASVANEQAFRIREGLS